MRNILPKRHEICLRIFYDNSAASVNTLVKNQIQYESK